MPASAGAGNFGMGMMMFGMISSAVGAHDAAAAQKLALSASAQLDQLNARSSAVAMNGQADLEFMNQKAGFEAMTFGSEMSTLGTEKNVFEAKSGAALGTLQATTQASMTLEAADTRAAIGTIQAGMQSDALEVGAHISEQNAALYEMQAQSSLLHGEWREQDSRMQYAQAKSRATVQMARGNVDLGEGSALTTRVGIDLMSERAANMIQADTLMQAFGQRVQASNATLDAGIRRAQAQTVLSTSAIANSADLQMAKSQAGAITEQAKLRSALTDMNAEFEMHMAQSQSDWTAAMESAGMLEANAAAKYKHTMATVLENNASAAASVKNAMASGISPGDAAITSLLGSAGQVAGAWYNYNRSKG